MRDLVSGLRSFWADPAGRVLLGITATVVGIGTVFYRLVEDLSWLDSLYFCVITLGTVGYGDISPQTAAGKIFTMVYIVVGIGVFVALVTNLGHHVIQTKRDPEPGE